MILKVENKYDINIGYKSDNELVEYLRKNPKRKICLITDENVYDVYKDRLCNILKEFEHCIFTFKPGEDNKSLETFEKALLFLSENNFSRGDIILAFGGGITGDLAGYIASSYLRGISFIAVPTTLLSMIDSSVGGKNGVNFNGLKNQVGSFYFPEYVHIDYSYLETLDERNINNGMAEMFKYGILCDKNLFIHLAKGKGNIDYEYVIKRSLEIKVEYVKNDERDVGKRQYLNLGHTIGHGVEALSNYTINHGEAVGIGIIKMAKASYELGITEKDFYKDIISEFKKYNLPTDYNYNVDEIFKVIKHDKKIKDNKINIIIPVEIGNTINKIITFEEFKNVLELGR